MPANLQSLENLKQRSADTGWQRKIVVFIFQTCVGFIDIIGGIYERVEANVEAVGWNWWRHKVRVESIILFSAGNCMWKIVMQWVAIPATEWAFCLIKNLHFDRLPSVRAFYCGLIRCILNCKKPLRAKIWKMRAKHERTPIFLADKSLQIFII
jgi:hypothetical protein